MALRNQTRNSSYSLLAARCALTMKKLWNRKTEYAKSTYKSDDKTIEKDDKVSAYISIHVQDGTVSHDLTKNHLCVATRSKIVEQVIAINGCSLFCSVLFYCMLPNRARLIIITKADFPPWSRPEVVAAYRWISYTNPTTQSS